MTTERAAPTPPRPTARRGFPASACSSCSRWRSCSGGLVLPQAVDPLADVGQRVRPARVLRQAPPGAGPRHPRRLEAGMRDADKGDLVRLSCASLLLAKNRLPVVEAALRDPRLDVRAIAMGRSATSSTSRRSTSRTRPTRSRRACSRGSPTRGSPGRARGINLVPKVFRLDQAPPPALLDTLRAALKPGDTAARRMRASPPPASSRPTRTAPPRPSSSRSRPPSPSPTRGWPDPELDGPAVRREGPAPRRQLREAPGRDLRERVPGHARGLRPQGGDGCARLPGRGRPQPEPRLGAMSVLARHPAWSGEALDRIRTVLATSRPTRSSAARPSTR